MRFGYMIDGSVYEPHFIEATSLKDAVAQLEGKLRVAQMAQKNDKPFIEVWKDFGVERKVMSFEDLSRVYKFYPETSGKLMCGDLCIGKGEFFDMDNYKGFMVCTNFDQGIGREDNTGNEVVCEGYYCEVYLADDEQLAFKLDDFCLAVGHEIEDLSDISLDLGVKRYIDDAFDMLFGIVDLQADVLDEKLLSIAPESMVKRSERLAAMRERTRISEKVKKASGLVDEVLTKNDDGKEIFGVANVVYMLKESEEFLAQDELLRLTARIHEASWMSVVPLLQAERVDAVRSLLEYGITENKSPEFPVATPEQAKELLLNCDMEVFIDLVDAVAVDNQRFYAPDVGQLSEEQLQPVKDAILTFINKKPALDEQVKSASEKSCLCNGSKESSVEHSL